MKRKFMIVIFVLLLIFGGRLALNCINTQYDALNETDRRALSELNAYYKSFKEEGSWKDFSLSEKTLLLMNGRFGSVYLVNPTEKPSGIFAMKIQMPEESSLEVYRLAYKTPKIFLDSMSGRFSTIGTTYTIAGNEVYYFRYDEENSFDKIYSSEHFVPMLAHESFHYYMQTDWAEGDLYDREYTTSDIELLKAEYEVLEKVRVELGKDEPQRTKLLEYTEAYLKLMKQRIESNPEYMQKELERETAEGTATYIGIKAAQAVEYDYGVMYFDNRKDVPFTEVVPTIEVGFEDEEFLTRRMPYETGALLCQLMDALEIPNWQETLNQQTKDTPITLYDVIADAIYL